jgi:hypothetical protein
MFLPFNVADFNVTRESILSPHRSPRSTYTKIWLEGQPPDADMNDLTTRFQDQGELFGRMFERFEQGYSHVKASLEAYLCEH